MKRIFISYNTKDASLANDVATALKGLGHEIAMDTVSLAAGEDWRAILDEELEASDVLVVLFTRNSVGSQYIAAEIGTARTIARQTGKMIIVPVVADSMPVPPLVSDLFAVIEPNRDVARIAAEINRAIASYRAAVQRPRGGEPGRDRTIGLILAAAVVFAFILFIFVPPDRLSPATLPIVRYLAAIAAALAAYLFIGSMTVGGRMPFFKRLEVKAAGSFAAFLVVLLLFYRGIPTPHEARNQDADSAAGIPACTLAASPVMIPHGGTARLTWSTAAATTVEITPDVGPVAANGSIDVSPQSTTTYTITARNASPVYARASVTVNVGQPVATNVPVTGSIIATPDTIARGESTFLRWNSSNATEVTITPDVGSVPLSGSVKVSPLATTTYTITMTNPNGGFGRGSATVYVR